MPKSAILIWRSALIKMFSGFRSRWQMLKEWQYEMALMICRKKKIETSSLRRPFMLIKVNKSPWSIYSSIK